MGIEEAREPRNWKIKRQDGSRLEPANLSVLRQWVDSGQIARDDLVINDDLADWVPASEVPELHDLLSQQGTFPDVTVASKEEVVVQSVEEVGTVQMPDCAFHPGRTASEICVGCGKFVCEECQQRLERKVYCHTCLAEKQAGIEPGAPVGPDAADQSGLDDVLNIPLSKLAIASLIFAVVALVASITMLIPGMSLAAAPAAGFLAFLAALLGGLSLNRLRLSGVFLRGRVLALTGLIVGCVVLAGSLVFAYVFTTRARVDAKRGSARETGIARLVPDRRSNVVPRSERMRPSPGYTKHILGVQEENARRLLEEAGELLSQGKLEEAHRFPRPIVTQIVPAAPFWPAEEYHQKYFQKHGGGSCHM